MRPTPGSVNDMLCSDNQAGLFQTDQIQCYEPAYTWTLYREDRNIDVGYKQNLEFHIWPVRSG
ncbi:hypothetical protein JCM12294_29200 [Desulfocicer niacini]